MITEPEPVGRPGEIDRYAEVGPFVECRAIVAAQAADLGYLRPLLARMLAGERVELARACILLGHELRDAGF